MAEKNLSRLAIAVIDEFEWVIRLQELLRLCQDELDNPGERSQLRLELLIDSYLSQVECHIEELEWRLKSLQLGLKEAGIIEYPDL